MLKNWVRDFTVFCVWGFNDFAFRKLETGLCMSLSSEIEWTWQSNYRFIEGRARNSCWKDCAVVIFRLYIKTILKLCDRPSQILFACCWLIPQVIWQQFSILTVIFFVVFSHAGGFPRRDRIISVFKSPFSKEWQQKGLIWEPDYVCSISGVCKDSVCEGLG